ncbi:MAG: hypothetical protein D6751_07310 [Deltaproteobacteria bacterium]|nr:MAG: hypothetical protein D6751_07310 [Deltaproteobacteria bacterium]
MTVKEFFEKYPNAKEVIKVGDCLFLAHHWGSAQDHAKRHGLKIERIPAPNSEEEDPGTGEVQEAGAEAQKPVKKRGRGRKKSE